jgi:Domain of unknown function (DUF4114)
MKAHCFVPSLLFAVSVLPLSAQTVSPIQATDRPYGLAIVAKVDLAGSDPAAKDFLARTLPCVSSLLNVKLSETHALSDSAMLLDPSKLKLETAAAVRVYFVGEGAGYHNALGFNTASGVLHGGNPELIFPDASSQISTYVTDGSGLQRTSYEPLMPGDFVDLGFLKKNTQLNFFLIANGANGGRDVFSTDWAHNPDHINHVIAFTSPDSPYLILAFEDLYGGGDRDFNDVIVAVTMGVVNLAALTSTPEPSMLALLAAFLALGFVARWRRRRATTSAPSGFAGS